MIRSGFKILLTVVTIAVSTHHITAQSGAEKLRQARVLMSDYQDASTFRDMNDGYYDPSWESIFRSLFRTNSIVFDVPFRVDEKRYRQSHFDPEHPGEARVISIFQENVSIDRYIETIRNAYDLFSISNFSYQFIETRFDTLKLGSEKMILFEFRKIFTNTSWSLSDSRSYLYEVRFFNGQPFINSVRAVEENIPKSDVVLRFVNQLSEVEIPDVSVQIRFVFDEPIYNTILVARTDSTGYIRPGRMANMATIRIDTLISFDGQRYSIPDFWRTDSIKISTQPSAGFKISLRPWRWNGFSWSVTTYGGMLQQSENRLRNFTSDSEFTNKSGLKYGAGLEVGKLFSISEIASFIAPKKQITNQGKLANRRNTFFGFSTGVLFYKFDYRITSDRFFQDPYPYLDRREEPLLVYVSGSAYEENVSGMGASIPVLFEFRKNMPGSANLLQSYSFQAGINLMIPFETKFEMNGIFNRHGYYEQFNQQFMLNDPFYNYYTNIERAYGNNIVNNEILPSWMFRFNTYFRIPRSGKDNLLNIGIMATVPFKSGNGSNPDAYFMATGNDLFNSLSQTKKEVFDYFIGLNIGYNFIRYRL